MPARREDKVIFGTCTTTDEATAAALCGYVEGNLKAYRREKGDDRLHPTDFPYEATYVWEPRAEAFIVRVEWYYPVNVSLAQYPGEFLSHEEEQTLETARREIHPLEDLFGVDFDLYLERHDG